MTIEINNKIIDLIYTSIIAEGGDGDAIWLSKHTSLDNLLELLTRYNFVNDTGWTIVKRDNHLSWGNEFEWALITNDINLFNKEESLKTLRIHY